MTTVAATPVTQKTVVQQQQHVALQKRAPGAVGGVEEPQAKKVDLFDAKKSGAPSPDVSGMVDDGDDDLDIDQDGNVDPTSAPPPIPARTLQPNIKV